jgi:ribosomal protein L37AE/L43A
MSESPITSPIHVPRDVKTRWVRQSQAVGMRLGDWVIQAVERPPNKAADAPCTRCAGLVLTSDGPGHWQCAQCGLAA